jgi:long-chain acyl-CoA synthetase
MLFITPAHLDALVGAVVARAKKSLVFPVAWRHKVSGLLHGFVTRESLWDRLVFNDARVAVLGATAATLRGVVVAGAPLPPALLTPARAALSIPLVSALAHPLAAAPLCASHPHDLQSFARALPASPVGPPVVNIEAKLRGIDDAAAERGEDPQGTLLVRGPPVGRLLDDDEDAPASGAAEDEPWIPTGVTARVQTNGSFVVLPQGK